MTDFQYQKLVLTDDTPRFFEVYFNGPPMRKSGDYGYFYVLSFHEKGTDDLIVQTLSLSETISSQLREIKSAKDDTELCFKKGEKFTLRLRSRRSDDGKPVSYTEVTEGWGEEVLAPETQKPVSPKQNSEPPPPPDEPHPHAPLQGNGKKEKSDRILHPSFSDMVNTFFACVTATKAMLDEDLTPNEAMWQGMTSTLFIACREEGVWLTREQVRKAVEHYRTTAEFHVEVKETV